MISKILRWNKKRWIIITSALIFLVGTLLIYNAYISRKRYEEQAVMAQEYLEAGSFEEAQEAYKKALSMNYGDKELMSIGLAEAYAGVHNYNKALEVLRSIYEVEKTTVVKEKIEEITSKKTDYGFYQLISFGDTYFSNGEYSKAIDEYEKAKLIKSKSDLTYLKIVDSYMAMEKFDLAKEEIEDGLAVTESEKLSIMMSRVEFRLKEIEYDEILLMASEYIYQENYEEAFNSFNDAIWIIPDRDSAYNQMAELYITLKDYDTAKALLQNYLRSNRSTASEEILNKANNLITQRKEKERVLNELYTALSVVDIDSATKIMEDTFFIDIIAGSAPFYYSPSGDMNINRGYGLLISDKNNVYAGGFMDRMREGIGIQFVLGLEGDADSVWYYYQGEWNHDMPSGMGKTGEKSFERDKEGKWQSVTTETSGMFVYGLESGTMQKTIYADGQVKNVYYTATDGVPKLYLDENSLPIQAEKPDQYVIGQLLYLNNEPTGEYYSVKNGTKYSVKLNNR
ncbi:MAG: tetratricopeptide repeat protein [Clostridiales bacterium]|jgi:tetratricopeptide (TPR) repeat protein|nr:tetratricopeptide repeat protein [Clostridiales bacterium]